MYLLDTGAFLFCWRYRGTLEEGGIGLWGMQLGMLLRFCGVDGERDARGRWHRSGQGLRRGILLGLRETAKSIAAGSELACGSDSRPCRNNAVSRSPSSNHPSSAAARPDATFLWLTLPTDRKKTEQVTEADWASCPEVSDWYRIFLCKYRRNPGTRSA